MSLLSAEFARGLMPTVDYDQVEKKIDAAIRAAAQDGKESVSIMGILAEIPWKTWSHARRNEAKANIVKGLRALGFVVDIYDGGHSGDASIEVKWGKPNG